MIITPDRRPRVSREKIGDCPGSSIANAGFPKCAWRRIGHQPFIEIRVHLGEAEILRVGEHVENAAVSSARLFLPGHEVAIEIEVHDLRSQLNDGQQTVDRLISGIRHEGAHVVTLGSSHYEVS